MPIIADGTNYRSAYQDIEEKLLNIPLQKANEVLVHYPGKTPKVINRLGLSSFLTRTCECGFKKHTKERLGSLEAYCIHERKEISKKLQPRHSKYHMEISDTIKQRWRCKNKRRSPRRTNLRTSQHHEHLSL